MDQQTIFNFIAGAILAGLGWWARTLWDAVGTLDTKVHTRLDALDTKVHTKIGVLESNFQEFQIEVARGYVSNAELAGVMRDVKEDLVYIRERVDGNPLRRTTDQRPPL